MASKSKKQFKRRSAVNLIDRVRRNLDRGDFKQALKDVRVCYRQSPTEEHRCFLEHACMGRAQQLMRNGLTDDCRRIVRELMDLGVTEPAVQAGLPELLLSVGMLDCLPQDHAPLAGEERSRLRVKAADQAVAKPENTPMSMPELRDEASRIRAALEAVQREDEPAALAHLKAIPRQSLFADWKYFVRGLIAYYGRDKSGMKANWDRLDPDRAAVKIAATLKVVAGVAPLQQDGNLRTKVNRLEKHAAHQAVLGNLTRLRQSVANHDWPQLLKTLRVAHGSLRQLNGNAYHRVISCLCGALVDEGCVEELAKFSRIVEPLPIDPRWNRAQALASENSDYYDDDPEEYWRRYLDDLESLPAISVPQRDLARGLVSLRLAEDYVTDAGSLRRCRCGAGHGPQIEVLERKSQAAFEQCLALAPDYAPGYAAAAAFHTDAERPEQAAELYTRLLEHVPDNSEALLFLVEHHLSHNRPLEACEFALRARELKPLDQITGELLWAAQFASARVLARTGQCDEARDRMAAADRVLPARKNNYDALARRAVLETKAGNLGMARQFIEQAQEQLDEPTALWLVMAIESIRYCLPKEEVWLYEKRWQQALKRRCHSATAGLMCRMLDAHLRMPQPYPDHEKHTQELLRYVRRCSRVKWQREDLRSVCEFLEPLEELKLLVKFAKKGVQKHPEVGYFHYVMGVAEMSKGPFRFKQRLAVERFQRGIELASKSSDPRDKSMVEQAKRYLAMAENVPDHGDMSCMDDVDDSVENAEADREAGVSAKDLRSIVERVCDKLGLDSEAVLDDIKNGRLDVSRGPWAER